MFHDRALIHVAAGRGGDGGLIAGQPMVPPPGPSLSASRWSTNKPLPPGEARLRDQRAELRSYAGERRCSTIAR